MEKKKSLMYDVSVDSLCFDSTYSSHRAPHIKSTLTQQEGCRGDGVSPKLALKTTVVMYFYKKGRKKFSLFNFSRIVKGKLYFNI